LKKYEKTVGYHKTKTELFSGLNYCTRVYRRYHYACYHT